jgi:hypothetical protein
MSVREKLRQLLRRTHRLSSKQHTWSFKKRRGIRTFECRVVFGLYSDMSLKLILLEFAINDGLENLIRLSAADETAIDIKSRCPRDTQ